MNRFRFVKLIGSGLFIPTAIELEETQRFWAIPMSRVDVVVDRWGPIHYDLRLINVLEKDAAAFICNQMELTGLKVLDYDKQSGRTISKCNKTW